MRCPICENRIDSKTGVQACSDICLQALQRRTTRERELASERRFAQCQVCADSYSPNCGDSDFCSARCRTVVWGSFVA